MAFRLHGVYAGSNHEDEPTKDALRKLKSRQLGTAKADSIYKLKRKLDELRDGAGGGFDEGKFRREIGIN